MNYYSWLEDYLARLDGKEARWDYYERYYVAWHQTAQKLAEAIMESHAMLASISAETRERQAQLTQDFFDSVVGILGTQAQRNWVASRELVEHTLQGQEAAQKLVQESANAYMDFLDSMFSYYRQNSRAVEESNRE